MLPVAIALSEALTMLGWDGAAERIGGEIRAASGMTLGRLEISVLPYTSVVVGGGRVANVTPTAFLEALVESWSKPMRPAAAPEAPQEPTPVVTLDAQPEPDEPITRHRTPWPWEEGKN